MVTFVLLDLMGGVALLLWGLHMVQSGVLRAFGGDLRRILAKTLTNRIAAFFAGLTLTALLQSSTATGIIAAGFAAEGTVSLVPALAIMLGANVGTTLVVQLLSFDMRLAAPVLFVVGLAVFRTATAPWLKNLGRVTIGLGLVLLALHLLIDTLAPAESAPDMRTLLGIATHDPILCILIAAALTWAAHSSAAMVLLTMSLAYSSFVTPEAALALVLGANLGSALNPLLEGTRNNAPMSYRLPVGNLLNRLVGVVLVTPFLAPLAVWLERLVPSAPQMVATFHMAFNLVLAVPFLVLLNPIARFLVKLLPERKSPNDPTAPRYLDETALETPSLALADAARETLHMGGLVEAMLRQVMTALMTNDRALVVQVGQTDDAVDRLEQAIKLYVTKLTRGSLDEREGRRALEIIAFAINLEHIGDIIDKNLNELAAKKIKKRLQFSCEGAAELQAFHKRILESFKLGLAVFMSGDVVAAQQLLGEKVKLREAERAAAEHHLDRLREGLPETVETTSLHLDVLRDLKRIHSHICSVAYPVLETARTASDAKSARESLLVPKTQAQPLLSQ